MISIFKRDRTFKEPISPLTTFIMLAFHAAAVAALFMFSWKAFGLAVLLWWIAGSWGIGMGYHRLLTHRGYSAPKWIEYALTLCGTLALEGGPIFWVATHRVHHQNTDTEGDPHSPRDGGFWSHMGWIISGRVMHNNASELLPYVPDLAERPVSRLDQQMALGPDHRTGHRTSCSRRVAIRDVGRFPAHCDSGCTRPGW